MEYKYLPDISENIDSCRKPITAKDRIEGDIPYYGASGVVDHVRDYIFDEELLLVSEDGANLVMRSTPIAFSITGKAWVNNHAHVLRFKDKKLQVFVEYYLNHIDLSPYISGSAQPKLNQQMLNAIPVPIPSSEIIEKTVAILDRIVSIKKQREKELLELDNLIKARFVELSSEWNIKETPLCDYLDEITYGFTNPMPDSESGPWKLTAKDIVDGHINFATARKTTQESFDALTAKSKPVIGDVLLTKDGSLGRTAVVEDERICVNQSVAVLRCNDHVIPRFLSLLLQLPEYQREMTKNSGGGTIKHIYITKVDKMLVKIPTIHEQECFIRFVEQVDKSKSAVQKALEETQLLFDSLMQKYFG